MLATACGRVLAGDDGMSDPVGVVNLMWWVDLRWKVRGWGVWVGR